MNEILLIGSVIIIYSMVLISYILFGKKGLFVFNAVATVLANIEVLILIEAFGMEQTLGNVLFASTYLVTDILSENEGKKEASNAVWLGVMATVLMLVLTQYWRLYVPSKNDTVMSAIQTIFSSTPRLIIASFIGYIVSQRFDVWLYHAIWNYTNQKCGERSRYLWLRNNVATLTAQMINTILFTTIAFAGKYSGKTLISIIASTYVIYIFTSLLDTPVVYLSRRIKPKKE